MARLAACYFCGIALDEPLETYPAVPRALRSDDADSTTVTLCPTCAEKLERVLGHVVDAVDDRDDSPAPGPSADVETDPDEVLVDPDGPPAGTTETSETPADSGVRTTPQAGTSESTQSAPDSPASKPTEGPAGSNPATSEETAVGTPEHEVDDGHGTEEANRDVTDSDRDRDSGRVDTTPDSDTTPDGDTTPDDTASDGDTDQEETDHDTDPTERSVVEGDHSISALEYNKVMRLLQNREFPIDREEIVTVASNAYGLARSDCGHVIDVAIDRGLIEEAGGQLRRPDND